MNVFRYFFFWFLSFSVVRLVFLAFNYPLTATLNGWEILQTLSHGFKADLSVTGYAMLIPALLLAFSKLGGKSFFYTLFKLYNGLAFAAISLCFTLDVLLYPHWGFRLDLTPFRYLLYPKEATASNSFTDSILFFGFLVGYFSLFYFAFKKYISKGFKKEFETGSTDFLSFGLYLLFTAALIIPIRGGLQQIPFQASSVFFSNKVYANHASLNPLWSLGYAIDKSSEAAQTYKFLDDGIANQMLDSIQFYNESDTFRLLNTTRPNVILILVESLTSNLVGVAGGEPDITPNLNRLAKEGVLFKNCYANGDRTEKGVAAVLSAQPTLPRSSWFSYSDKAEKFEGIIRDLKRANYYTGFTYGGEADFSNMKSYLLAQGIDKLTEKSDFGTNTYSNKWGAYDHFVLDRVAAEDFSTTPFLKIILTLSSHEPFDVPMKTVIAGTDEANLFRNSMVYTDSAIGAFIEKCKTKPWWQNTVVIIVGDHGHRLPSGLSTHEIKKFKTPLIWLGGALKNKGMEINQTVAQADIVPTLMRELGLPHKQYRFGKPFSPNNKNFFAFYAFNNGFGVVKDDENQFIFDLTSQHTLFEKGNNSTDLEAKGEAYLQILSKGMTTR